MTAARWCRAAAVLIAVFGVVDPSLTLARSARPTVSILDTSGNAAFADRVARTLAEDAVVVRGLTADAAAVVVAGGQLPAFAGDIAVPSFVVRPEGPMVQIDRVTGPSRTPLDARASITAAVRVTGARGQTLSVALAANGVGLDRVDRSVIGDDVRLEVPLTFVPSAVGPARLHVTASLSASTASASADTLTRVDRSAWTILAFDPRPSWMATFVRRALEDDDRFAVAARTITSRGVATNTPAAPPDLGNPAALDRFDAIVVGAPDALSSGDVAQLSAYLTRRGGAVILLWDVRPTGPALALMGVDRWMADTEAADRAIASPAGAMRASDLAWPARLPVGADAIGRTDESPAGGDAASAPVIWRADRGPGRVVVSGALDSWRYRAAPQTAFDDAWRRIVADAAALSPPPLAVDVDPAVARPGERVTVHATLREAALAATSPGSPSAIRSTIALTWRNAATSDVTTLRAWPDGAPGRFVATTAAPAQSGAYEVIAASDAVEATADVAVDAAAASVRDGEADAIGAWATSRGGRVIDAGARTDLPAAIRHLARPEVAPTRAHPMRSAWWIAPMTLLTGIEWWTRRRRGRR